MPEYKFARIPVAKLSVDETNFRTGDVDGTREAYRAMIEEEGTDLTNLADDIVELGFSPAERFIVSPDPNEEGSYIVHEGNRRVTALKLMENPDLARGTTVEKQFRRYSDSYLKNPITELDCVIMKDKEEALPWCERKHQKIGGRGLSPWGAPAQARAEAYRGRVRPSKAVLDQLRDRKLLPIEVDKKLTKFTTNLDRVLQMPYLRGQLGIDIRRDGSIEFAGGKDKAGAKLLLDILNAMAAEGFNVNDIRDVGQREKFIDSFLDRTLLEAGGTSGTGSPTTGAKAKARRRQPSALDRKALALGGRTNALTIKEKRLNSLYEEALLIRPDITPNCSGILMRVFLELSAEYYARKFKLPIPKKLTKRGKTSWSEIGVSLSDKVRAVLESLDPKQNDPELKMAWKGISSNDYLHSLTTLHQYVHDLAMDAEGKEMKKTWDRWHAFLTRLFDAANQQKP